MATERLKTIKPSGGDYTSLSAAEAGEDDLGDLVSRDEWMHFSCYAMEDTTAVTIVGWTTDATRFIQIDTPLSERHDGEWNTNKYRLSLTNAPVWIQENNIHFVGIQFQTTENRADYYPGCTIYNNYDYCNDLQVDKCIFKGVDGGINSNGLCPIYIVGGYFASTPIKIQNSIFIGCDGTWQDVGIRIHSPSQAGCLAYVYNCTFKDKKIGIATDSSANLTIRVKNCGFISCADDMDGTITDATTNSTSTPTLASGKSFHLASNDTTWLGQGTDLSADDGIINSQDIDGETRSGSWDIGADEYVAAAGGSPRGHVFMRPFVGPFRRAL